MKRLIALLLVFWVYAFAGVSQAAVVTKMYEVSLPVLDQDKAIRNAAFEQAFIQVLVRVTGSSMVPAQLDIKQAPRYVAQYRYTALETTQVKQETPDQAPVTVANYDLWIQFNEAAIKKLLKDNELPLWGKQRPSVLVWLVVRDGRNRYVLRAKDYSSIKEVVEKEAQRRGLPLLWPAYDDQDKKLLGFADIWGGFWEPVMQASQRYGVDAVLVGRMNWVNAGWQVDWSLKMGGRVQSWHLNAPDLAVVMGSGIDVATDQIANRFAVQEGISDEGELLVQVKGIGDVEAYSRSIHYLQSLAMVRTVYPRTVANDVVDFHVDVSGNREDLKRIIGLGDTLVADPMPAKPTPVASADTAGGNPGSSNTGIQPQTVPQAIHYHLKP